MKIRAVIALAALLSLVTASYAEDREAPAVKKYGSWGIDLAGMDRSVKPGDDFFRYVNGKWADSTEIPADRTSFGSFLILRDLSEKQVRTILDRWAADEN